MPQADILDEVLAGAHYSLGPEGQRLITLSADDFEALLAEFRDELRADALLIEEAIETDTEFIDYDEVRARLIDQGKL